MLNLYRICSEMFLMGGRLLVYIEKECSWKKYKLNSCRLSPQEFLFLG